MYDFDEIIDRRGTWTEKYAELNLMFGTEDVLPLWVADTGFCQRSYPQTPGAPNPQLHCHP